MEQNQTIEEFYLSNENPFAFYNSEINSKESKNRLEAVFSIQPSFIPFAIEQSELKNSLNDYYSYVDQIQQEAVNQFCVKIGVESTTVKEFIDHYFDTEDEEVIELLIKLEQLKLFNKQRQLRDRIILGLREVMSEEQLSRAFSKRVLDENKDCAVVEMLEKKNQKND